MGITLAVSFGISLILTAATGLVLVPALRRMNAGQSIREDGPVWHSKKQGTPTMGGIMFITGISLTCLTMGFRAMRAGEYSHLYVLFLALAFGAIGFLDDYEKLRKKQNLGLTAKHKFAIQLAVACAFVLVMRFTGNPATGIYIPFFGLTVQMHPILYYALAVFVIVGTANAVNITDGVDGLATGVSIPVALCYMFISFLWGLTALGVLAAAIAGALVAFLLFNFHPAKVIMGDTGSMFLGGAICATAFAMDIPLILVTLGIIYIIETFSDIIQIAYYKLTHGKRIFRMAPIHHHLELCGWSEYKLFVVFTIVSAVFAVISYFGVVSRYS